MVRIHWERENSKPESAESTGVESKSMRRIKLPEVASALKDRGSIPNNGSVVLLFVSHFTKIHHQRRSFYF